MNVENKIRLAVAGATGYSGKEFLRWIKRHPKFEVAEFIGRDTDINTLGGKVDAAVLATPANVSYDMAPKLINQGIRVVDVSGAFRLKEFSYPEWYNFEHKENDLLQNAVYGLYPWIKTPAETKLVANPGCYTTTSLMALIPLLKEEIIDPRHIYIDAKSGASGAGKKPAPHLMYAELNENVFGYKTGSHQHWPEIVECIKQTTDLDIKPVFTTQLLPTFRGILATIYSEWHPSIPAEKQKQKTILDAYNKHYSKEADIIVSEKEVQISDVANTNNFAVSGHEAYGRPLVFASTDNLVRGAAGQALVNLNQIFGFNPNEGLL